MVPDWCRKNFKKAQSFADGGIVGQNDDDVFAGAVPQGERTMSATPDNGYGTRPNGTNKGKGFLGELKMKDGSGKVATEMTVGVNFDGKERDIPLIVPDLSGKELDHLLSGKQPTRSIIDKAVGHARRRLDQGMSPYAD